MPSSKKQRAKQKKLARHQKELKKPYCHCGVTDDKNAYETYDRCMKEYFQLAEHYGVKCETVFINKYPELCADEGFIEFLIAHSATVMLQNPNIEGDFLEFHVPRVCMLLAMRLIYRYIPASKGQDFGPESNSFAKYRSYTDRLMTKRGLVRIINKHTDCNCLGELAAVAKQMESTRRCVGCVQEVPRDEIWLCSGCRIMPYCSKECQTKDWVIHKKDCMSS